MEFSRAGFDGVRRQQARLSSLCLLRAARNVEPKFRTRFGCLEIPSREGWRAAPGWVFRQERPTEAFGFCPLPGGVSLALFVNNQTPQGSRSESLSTVHN